MEFIADDGKQFNGKCSTLVLPAISVGNVGQLAADLLIASSKSEKVGYIDDPNVIPCIGNDAYRSVPEGEIVLPVEVYESSNNLAFVQQRSPFIKGKIVESSRNMSEFALSAGVKHVIILSSLDFRQWKDIDTSNGRQMYYLSSSNGDGRDDACEELGWKRLHEYDPEKKWWKYLSRLADGTAAVSEEEEEKDDRVSSMHNDDLEDEGYCHASFPFAALFCCLKAKGLKVTCLLRYCSEGDNTDDAFRLADATCKLMGGGVVSGWSIPLSWRTVYGPPPEISLF